MNEINNEARRQRGRQAHAMLEELYRNGDRLVNLCDFLADMMHMHCSRSSLLAKVNTAYKHYEAERKQG